MTVKETTLREKACRDFWITMKPLVGDTPADKAWCDSIIDRIIEAAQEGMVSRASVQERDVILHGDLMTEIEDKIDGAISLHYDTEHIPKRSEPASFGGFATVYKPPALDVAEKLRRMANGGTMTISMLREFADELDPPFCDKAKV